MQRSIIYTSLRNLLKDNIKWIFNLDIEEVTINKQISLPPKPEMGDMAFSCFLLARELKKSPQMIANELSMKMIFSEDDIFKKVEQTGPYLNFFLNEKNFSKAVLICSKKGSLTKPFEKKQDKIMVEFSQPNTHKGIHIGHIRNMAIGDSLIRILRHTGYETISANYLGDSGAHIAACLWYYEKSKMENTNNSEKGEWLGIVYTEAKRHLEDNPSEKNEVSKVQKLLEDKDPHWIGLWNKTREWSIEYFKNVYDLLDIHFDVWFYESEEEEPGKVIVEEFLNKGIFKYSDGAVICELEDLPLAIVLKSDGTTLYSTKDLALAKRKFEEFHIDRSIYVVGDAQSLHFKQIFSILKKMGFKQADKCYHLAYGMVSLPEGKMSSRTGNVVLFSDLKKSMNEYIYESYLEAKKDWNDEKKKETSRKIIVAAIKFGMLDQDVRKNIEFRMEDWLSFEGDTGPYILYAFARIQSILRKSEKSGMEIEPDLENSHLLTMPEEKYVIMDIQEFPDIIEHVANNYCIDELCKYLLKLSKDFSKFYHNCPILKADRDLAAARLQLIIAVSEILKTGLNLLGIDPPEEM